MDHTDFLVDRAQHMRPLEYDLSDNFNELVRYLNDMGVLNNIPVGTIGPSEIISANDALTAPLRSLVVGGNSVQDGTPTPDAPVEIQSVVNPLVTFAGKNLLSLVADYKTTGAATATVTDESVTVVATSTAAWPYARFSVDIPAKAASYTISAIASKPESRIVAEQYDADGTRVTYNGTSGSATDRHLTFTTTDEITHLEFLLYGRGSNAGNVGDTCTYTNVQLELGSTATTYEPYNCTTVTLPVTLRSLPDGTKDTLALTYLRPSTLEGWAWYGGEVTRRCGLMTLDGTQNGFISASGTYTRFGMSPADSLACTPMADKLASYPINDLLTHPYGINMGANNRIYFSLNETITEFAQTRTWFAENPVTLHYALATPTTETLDPIELPSVIGPSCTIWATADATPTLTAQYIRDLSAAINDMQEAIADI